MGKKSKIHILIIFIFFLIAASYHLAIFNGQYPYLDLTRDAASIASYAAARDYPELFKGDEALGNPKNYKFYLNLHILILPLLKKIFGDYGTAFHSMLGPHIFLQCIGFYLLGLIVYQNIFFAFLLALTSLITIPLKGLATYWGLYPDALPRNTFQVFFPFLLCVAYIYRAQASYWPFAMIFAGLLIYIHPVSAPTWGLAVWLGFWLYLPTTWSTSKKILYMWFLGLIFLLVITPFAINYLQHHALGGTTDYAKVWAIRQIRLPRAYLDTPFALKKVFDNTTIKYLLFLTFLSIVYLYRKFFDKKSISLYLTWYFAIIFCSVVIHFIDYSIAKSFNKFPIEIDLIRTIKFLLPMSIFICFLFISSIKFKKYYFLKYLAGIALFMLIFISQHNYKYTFNPISAKWSKDGFFKNSPNQSARLRAFNFLKNNISPGTVVLPLLQNPLSFSAEPMVIRYFSLKPLAYSYIDGGLLTYNNHVELIDWYEKTLKLKDSNLSSHGEIEIEELIELSKNFSADIVIIDTRKIIVRGKRKNIVLFQNKLYTVLNITVVK